VATLSPVVGADHLRASVNVEFDPSTQDETQEKYDPAVSVPLQIQRSDEESGSKAGVGGVPGTTSNVPQKLPNVPPAAGVDSNAETSKTESATYGVNKITLHSMQPAGRVKRITAALLVDDAVTRKQEKNGKWSDTRIKRTAQELQQIQILAQNAIGIDTARGDVITVQNLPFATEPDAEMTPVSAIERVRKGMSDYSTLVRYAMLIILFVMAYILMIRPVQKRALAGGETPPKELPGPEPEPAMAYPIPIVNAGASTRALKEQLVQQVTSEPVRSARLIQSWLREENK
jgi:flagellar M-ring protein FliF